MKRAGGGEKGKVASHIILNEQQTMFTGCTNIWMKSDPELADRQTDGKRRKVREMMKTAKRVEARRGMFILPAIM